MTKISEVLYVPNSKLDSLSQMMQNIERYNPDRFIKAPIMERLEKKYFSECSNYKQNGDFKSALACYLEVKQRFMNQRDSEILFKSIAYCQYQIGLSFFYKKDYASANKWFSNINKKFYDYPVDINYHMGICQFKMGNYKRTIQLLEKIDRGLEIEYYKAYSFIELGQYQKACNILCFLQSAHYSGISDLDILVRRHTCNCPN